MNSGFSSGSPLARRHYYVQKDEESQSLGTRNTCFVVLSIVEETHFLSFASFCTHTWFKERSLADRFSPSSSSSWHFRYEKVRQ